MAEPAPMINPATLKVILRDMMLGVFLYSLGLALYSMNRLILWILFIAFIILLSPSGRAVFLCPLLHALRALVVSM